MRVFLDFEASSLGRDSYPIEIGWVAEDGSCEAHLIRPAPAWSDWDAGAEALHGLTRERLLQDGEPHDRVARRSLDALAGHELFASAPSWDGKWMSVLLRAAGLPRRALRLKDSDQAHLEAAVELLRGHIPEGELESIAAGLLETTRRRLADTPPRHRALADARAEFDLWREIRRLARDEVRRLGA